LLLDSCDIVKFKRGGCWGFSMVGFNEDYNSVVAAAAAAQKDYVREVVSALSVGDVGKAYRLASRRLVPLVVRYLRSIKLFEGVEKAFRVGREVGLDEDILIEMAGDLCAAESSMIRNEKVLSFHGEFCLNLEGKIDERRAAA